MTVKENIQGSINRIAETHFMIKGVIVKNLKNMVINPELRHVTAGAQTYYELWTKTYNDRFYDMGTLIRLATEIENGLKYYYMDKKELKNLVDLGKSSGYNEGVFQRIFSWSNNNVMNLYKNRLGYDLNENPFFKNMQELMLYRHLYAHNSGLLNEKFVKNYYKITNKSVSEFRSTITYPQQDTYFFEPLSRLNDFIEDARRFFDHFP
jgi:hypothetical protein